MAFSNAQIINRKSDIAYVVGSVLGSWGYISVMTRL